MHAGEFVVNPDMKNVGRLAVVVTLCSHVYICELPFLGQLVALLQCLTERAYDGGEDTETLTANL